MTRQKKTATSKKQATAGSTGTKFGSIAQAVFLGLLLAGALIAHTGCDFFSNSPNREYSDDYARLGDTNIPIVKSSCVPDPYLFYEAQTKIQVGYQNYIDEGGSKAKLQNKKLNRISIRSSAYAGAYFATDNGKAIMIVHYTITAEQFTSFLHEEL